MVKILPVHHHYYVQYLLETCLRCDYFYIAIIYSIFVSKEIRIHRESKSGMQQVIHITNTAFVVSVCLLTFIERE